MSDATAGEGKPLGTGRLGLRDPPADGPFFSKKFVELNATRKNSRDPEKFKRSGGVVIWFGGEAARPLVSTSDSGAGLSAKWPIREFTWGAAAYPRHGLIRWRISNLAE